MRFPMFPLGNRTNSFLKPASAHRPIVTRNPGGNAGLPEACKVATQGKHVDRKRDRAAGYKHRGSTLSLVDRHHDRSNYNPEECFVNPWLEPWVVQLASQKRESFQWS
jgi:hypothetical protein